MKSDNYSLIDSTFEEKLRHIKLDANARLERTLPGPIPPNAILRSTVYKIKEYRRLREAAICSWWMGDLGFLIRLDIEDKLRYYTNEEKIELRLILSSKYSCLEFIFNNYTERSFFGSLVPNVVNTATNLNVSIRNPNKPKKTVRRRGYRDHGSCRPPSRWLPSSDWSFTEKMLEIEKERQTSEDTFQFLRGLFGEV